MALTLDILSEMFCPPPSDVFNGFPQPLWHTLNYGMAASFPHLYKFIHYIWTSDCCIIYNQEGYVKQTKMQKSIKIPTPHSVILLVTHMVEKKSEHKSTKSFGGHMSQISGLWFRPVHQYHVHVDVEFWTWVCMV